MRADTPLSRAQDRIQRELNQKDAEGYAYMLDDPKGRWFLMRLYEHCHIMSSTFPLDGQTNRFLLNEGARRVALGIQNKIGESEESLRAMALARKEYYQFMLDKQRIIDSVAETQKGNHNGPFEYI